jgi:hypothetical protein
MSEKKEKAAYLTEEDEGHEAGEDDERRGRHAKRCLGVVVVQIQKRR